MSSERDTDGTAYYGKRVDGVLEVHRPGTEWLSTGWNGGRWHSDSAYNISVPEGWTCTNLDSYVRERLSVLESKDTDKNERERQDIQAPVLLTGVELQHARGARCGPVTVYATAGFSNPAALPMNPEGGSLPGSEPDSEQTKTDIGTVNLLVGTTRALESGALANLIAVAAEAKATTLLSETGFPGTTTDAIVVGHDPDGPYAEFSGSATAVGAATRACVREALCASIRSRYEETDATIPDSVEAATYGVSTETQATVFRPDS